MDTTTNNTKMESCVMDLMKQGKSKDSAIAICKSSIMKSSMKANERCWFFYDIGNFSEVKEGQRVKIQIMRVGQWQHQEYGDVVVTPSTLIDVKKNFDENIRKIDIAIDENHDPDHKALGWVRSLEIKDNDSLWAEIEITALGSRLLSDGAYKYFSPELSFNYKDGEIGSQPVKNVLVGGAFTNRPYFKAMSPLLLANEKEDFIFMFKDEEKKTMNKFMAFISKHEGKTLSAEEKNELKQLFDELPEEDKTEEAKQTMESAMEEKKEDGADDEAKKAEEEKAKAEAEAKAKEEAEQKAKEEEEAKKNIQANEGKTVTIKASEYEELKEVHKTVSKLMTESRTIKASEKTKSMVYSESNKSGMISAKQENVITQFAASLSESQEEKFWEIMSSLKSFNFDEKGHGGDGKNEDEKFAEEQVNWLIEKNLAANEEEAKEILKTANFSEKK